MELKHVKKEEPASSALDAVAKTLQERVTRDDAIGRRNSRPGVTKGQHWHNTKWEFFIVVAGHGLIQERRIGTDPATGRPYEPIEFEVSGDKIQAVHMLPGCTHSIADPSDTEDLVTVMWANEPFDPSRPDTFFESV